MTARLVAAARGFAGGAIGLAVVGVLAFVTHQPWLLPSLGPTAMLHAERPAEPSSSPRNTLIGHAVALLAGYALLTVCGLRHAPSVLHTGVSPVRVVAAAGSVAVTALVLALLDATHSPAGATALIVSLGLVRTPAQLLVVAGSVLVLTVVDWLFDRATGRAMPVWRHRRPPRRRT